MVNETLVDILVSRIINKQLNPKTNKPIVIDDIKIEEYKIAVENKISEQPNLCGCKENTEQTTVTVNMGNSKFGLKNIKGILQKFCGRR